MTDAAGAVGGVDVAGAAGTAGTAGAVGVESAKAGKTALYDKRQRYAWIEVVVYRRRDEQKGAG